MDSYRTVEVVGGGVEPQMLWRVRGEDIWVPLTPDGYWLDPDAASTGVITRRILMR